MQNIAKIFIIIVLFFCYYFNFNSAIFAQVVFPDSRKLQPIPEGVRANVSGNINSDNNNQNKIINNPSDNYKETYAGGDYSELINSSEENLNNTNSKSKNLFNLSKYAKQIVFFALSSIFLIIFLFAIKNKKNLF